MPTIIALNPRKKGKKKQKKKRKRPAMTALQKKYFGKKSERKVTKPMAKRKTAIKRRRTNPKKKRSIKRYTRQTLGGINIMGAAKSTVPLLFGALVAKFAAKKFADGGAESDNWTWKNYLLAATGGFVAAFGTSAVLKKRAAAQKVFEGSLLLIAYKVFTNEIAPMSDTTESWFGAAEDEFDPYAGVDGLGDVGDIYPSGNEDYVKGIDGYWRPVSESHRIPPTSRGMDDVMVNPDPRYGGLGDVMVQPDPRFGATDDQINQMIENDAM